MHTEDLHDLLLLLTVRPSPLAAALSTFTRPMANAYSFSINCTIQMQTLETIVIHQSINDKFSCSFWVRILNFLPVNTWRQRKGHCHQVAEGIPSWFADTVNGILSSGSRALSSHQICIPLYSVDNNDSLQQQMHILIHSCRKNDIRINLPMIQFQGVQLLAGTGPALCAGWAHPRA